ncbi:S-adenosyl-L-methionine-dependent methyltransferase [Mycena latifolia]|nr:S-adenosyl-L-methionine-dependent methyltransferase [Mycena latifolia]
MAPPRRPSAWEVSFPEEAMADLYISSSNDGKERTLKRKADLDDGEKSDASQRVSIAMRPAYYKPPRRFVVETADYTAPGEDPEPDDNQKQKPIRILSNFCIFDPANKNEFVLLDLLEVASGRQFSAAGVVLLADEDEEDRGQEDGVDVGEDTAGGDHVRLDNIIDLCPFDYFTLDAAVYIETEFAFYELRGPSTRYKPYLLAFSAPRLVARAVLMWVSTHQREDLRQFRAQPGAKGYTDEDLAEAVPYIREAIDEQGGTFQRSPLILELLHTRLGSNDVPRRRTRPRRPQPRNQTFLGNPDLALLKSENQSATHVTPFIAELAKGYFEETLQVMGAAPPKADMGLDRLQKANALRFLKDCIHRVRAQERGTIAFSAERSQPWRYGRYVEEATIGEEVYKSGDFVCIRKGEYRGVPAPLMVQICDVPDDALLPDYFWFARIIYFNHDSKKVHIQWLEHGSQIVFEEMAHPRELFLNVLCEDQDIRWIAGRISVVYAVDPPRKREQYFVRSVYDERDASFTSLDEAEMNRIFQNLPPDNCLPCFRYESHNNNAEWCLLNEDSPRNGKGLAGIAFQGHKYHFNEFFLYLNHGDGPAHIGYLKNIQENRRGRGPPRIEFYKVGRVSMDLKGIQLGEDVHNEYASVSVGQLVRPIHVYARDFFLDLELKKWVNYSPDHFYCSFRLPSLTAKPRAGCWDEREEVLQNALNICEFCPSDMYRWEQQEGEFQAEEENQDYHCLDLFGGTGAFGLGVAEGSRGFLQPTHLIEITPSAARTAQKNSDMTVYCQDANLVLRYFIKSSANHNIETPLQLFDNKTPLPPPIKPGKMRAIFIGLPCQSHSGLNMYRKAEDPKSNLMLTAASYVDFFRPDFVFLENVPGFLKYNLLAQQASRHRLEGGVEMGGLKLLLRALQDMKYTFRFALLQAGNYGVPQSRVRFFLIAARHGLPLPDMPQPTHDFEVVNQLRIRLPYNRIPMTPIRTTRGTMPHASVSVEDAIGDLPQYDWKHPDPGNANASLRQLLNLRERKGIPAYACERDKTHCGYEGVVAYRHEPRTSFQRQARERPTENIQHFSRCLLPRTVERVVTIPLEPGADFRSLPARLAEWQFFSPVSAVGRNKYRGGLYGRLDKNGYFPTTVTNMHPTAKQSKVLHPDCLRMVTVRELARSQGFPDWFVFVSINNNVVTLHRQIGNAVPWQVSQALGRELRIAVFKKWKENKLSAVAAAAGNEGVGTG